MKHSLLVIGAAAGLLALAGCGTRKPVVTGVVTLDGQPLANADVTFYPAAGDGQPSAAVTGPDGRYRMEASPTRMKVVIHASKVVGQRKMYEGQADSPMVEIHEDLLPARFGDLRKTELTCTVEPGENVRDFALTGDKKK